MTDAELVSATLTSAGELVRRKQISPLELTRAYLDRIERLDGHFRAYIAVTPKQALAAAERATQEIARGQWRGPLHGIPIAYKDLFAVRGVPMTCGSKVMADHLPDCDATAVLRMAEAGAISLGKLNLHEFAWGGTSINPHYGTPRNPWHPEYISGGSSGGSGVALAGSLALGSLGTDTGGSVRIPSALCGVVGLKPTYGRVSRYGVFPLCWSFDNVGPMGKTVEDVAHQLQVLAGYDPKDPTSSRRAVPNYAAALTDDVKGLRLGVPTEHFFEGIEPIVRERVDAAIHHLCELGAIAEPVSLPLMSYVPQTSYVMMLSEAYAVQADMLRNRAREYGDDVRTRLLMGGVISADDYLKAQRFRRLLRDQVMRILGRVDALVTPTSLITAKRIDQPTARIADRDIVVNAYISRCTRPFNMTGVPALSVPCGFSAEGLPVGLQVVGRPFDEETVLRIAHAYERSTPWHERRPTVSA
ncbi:MAG: amidase [Candidatus Binatia bacterium]